METKEAAKARNLGTSYLHKPLGEVLIEAGLVTTRQIAIALQEQKECGLKLGEILALRGWLKQKTADFFVEHWQKMIAEDKKQPLVVYFLKSGLLDKQQVRSLLYRQKYNPDKIRFHRLVVEQGYLKQITVDYFLANIFNIKSSNVFSFTKPFEVIKSYTDGKTNFKHSQLANAPLRGVTLKNVELDNSDLNGADLEGCNLSNSSMTEVNLTEVNLHRSTLTDVKFQGACLLKASLKECYLQGADLRGANLQGTDLSGAYLLKTSFQGADLRDAILPDEYPYDVYYDEQTIFDESFDPIEAGWIKLNS